MIVKTEKGILEASSGDMVLYVIDKEGDYWVWLKGELVRVIFDNED